MTADKAAALDAAARRVGDRWSLRVIGALLDGDHTFGELASAVDGIAPTILTSRLRSLQRMALVTAVPYETRPVRMRYSLTEPGRRLGASIASLAEWGAGREGQGTRPGPRRVRVGRRDASVVPHVRPNRRRGRRRPHLVLEPLAPGRCPGTWWAPPPSKRSGRAIPVRRVRFPSTSAVHAWVRLAGKLLTSPAELAAAAAQRRSPTCHLERVQQIRLAVAESVRSGTHEATPVVVGVDRTGHRRRSPTEDILTVLSVGSRSIGRDLKDRTDEVVSRAPLL